MIRTTNLLERLFRGERRRVNAAGTLFGERAVLKLMYAALIRASDSWRGTQIASFERRQLEQLKEQLQAELRKRHAPVFPSAQTITPPPSRIYSNKRTISSIVLRIDSRV